MTTIEVLLPDELNADLERLSLPKADIILSALRSYLLQQQKKQRLEEAMKEGYLSGNEEARMLSKEFQHVDLSNWDEY